MAVGIDRATTIVALQRGHGHPYRCRTERAYGRAPRFLYLGRRPARAKPRPPEAVPQRPLAGRPFPSRRPGLYDSRPRRRLRSPPAQAAQVLAREPRVALVLLPQGGTPQNGDPGGTCLPWVAERRGPAGLCKALRALRGVSRVTVPRPAVRAAPASVRVRAQARGDH